MNYDELVALVALADDGLIRKKLEELGFRDCQKDEKLKKANIVYMIQGTIYETEEDSYDKNRMNVFSGYVCVENHDFQGYLFVVIERCKLNKRLRRYISDGFIIYGKENV